MNRVDREAALLRQHHELRERLAEMRCDPDAFSELERACVMKELADLTERLRDAWLMT